MRNTLLLILLVFSPIALAKVQPAMVFTDGAVLQRDKPVRVWGTADPGEQVTVRFADQTKTQTAGADGKWLLTLSAMPANATPRIMSFESPNNEPHTLQDVVVGEVWLAGGQSNMATPMGTYRKKTQPDIDAANDPLLRMITIPRRVHAGQSVNAPQWHGSTPEHVERFSGTAYYFAKALRASLGVPIGIISCNYGGTPAEAWMSRQTLTQDPALRPIIDAYDHHVKTAFKDEADYLAKARAYKQAFSAFRASQKNPDKSKRLPRPQEVMGPINHKRPAGLHENMLAETIPSTLRGVIWYQGENNAGSGAGAHYRKVFSALIREWRAEYQNPDMPFFFVQLASYGWGQEPYWPELREAQQWVEDNVPNTGMIVLLDGGEKTDIHPHSKDIAGNRLARLARHQVYGESGLIYSGPTVQSASAEGSKLVLSFDNTGSGLVLKDGGENTFEVCGKDGIYQPAQATLEDGQIVVWSQAVPSPRHARYGWHTWVVPTLFNQEGLPAGPFRTDDFPLTTEGRYLLDNLAPRQDTGVHD